MTRRVYKYTVEFADISHQAGQFSFGMPVCAQIVMVGPQEDRLCIWAIVDPEAPEERRDFLLAGTGHPLPKNIKHLQSFQLRAFVWHVFETPLQ